MLHGMGWLCLHLPHPPHATPLNVGVNIIFINCLRRGIFPEIWKHANVVPVHKKKEKNVKENYRPISLLRIFGKILEKLIFETLYSHPVSSNLLNPNQSGFRPGDSIINQLTSITHTIFIYSTLYWSL